MKSSLFLKLLGAAFVLIAATLLVVDTSVTRFAARNRAENVQQRLEAQLRMIRSDSGQPELSNLSGQPLQEWAASVGRQARVRVTITNAQEQVVADSDPAAESGAISVAEPVALRDGPGMLRFSAPLDAADRAIGELRQRILTVSLGAAIFALLIAYRVSRSLSDRVSQLKRFAESLLESGFPPAPVGDSTATSSERWKFP